MAFTIEHDEEEALVSSPQSRTREAVLFKLAPSLPSLDTMTGEWQEKIVSGKMVLNSISSGGLCTQGEWLGFC